MKKTVSTSFGIFAVALAGIGVWWAVYTHNIQAELDKFVAEKQKQKLVQHVPLERLLLESDSPVLGPDKEQRNEPQNVWLSCLHIAAIKGVPVEAVAHITTANAQQLFPRAFA